MVPRRRSNTGLIVAGVLVVVAVLSIGGIGLVASMNSANRVADSGYTAIPSYTNTHTTSARPSTTTTTTTTTTPSRATSSARPTTSTPNTPAGPRAVIALGDNPMNAEGLGAMAATCDLPKFNTSPQGQDAFYRAALPCLEQAWAPMLQRANLPYQPVQLQTITSDVSTPCGNRSALQETALFCDGVIYMTARYYSETEGLGAHPGKYLGVLAHEYGHHVQWLSGTLKASVQAQYDAGGWDTEKGLEINRRKELQASCLGAMFIAAAVGRGSVNQTIAQEAIEDESQRGDWPKYPYRDHGSPELNKAWVQQGYQTNRTSACNTWLASSADVA
ncbi:neutral zinc metallopeptidase [Goodfellowiella coeruleoviolacea]|uniref:neutral zinc metallopeptidase n=1 Tax=Goodfellowiella coeruleoviolacea TaxID=334858 RepID=UPI0027E07C09|nr:neutral zinc metallopeptidase [Goodfellowiella coeruleoviolacea]